MAGRYPALARAAPSASRTTRQIATRGAAWDLGEHRGRQHGEASPKPVGSSRGESATPV